MAYGPRDSLFDARYKAGISWSLDAAATFVTGDFATSLAIIAVALVGFLMLSGRLVFLQSLRVIVGCFVLFGASAIAALLMGSADETWVPARIAVDTENAQPREELPPSDYSPYSRASARSSAK